MERQVTKSEKSKDMGGKKRPATLGEDQDELSKMSMGRKSREVKEEVRDDTKIALMRVMRYELILQSLVRKGAECNDLGARVHTLPCAMAELMMKIPYSPEGLLRFGTQ